MSYQINTVLRKYKIAKLIKKWDGLSKYERELMDFLDSYFKESEFQQDVNVYRNNYALYHYDITSKKFFVNYEAIYEPFQLLMRKLFFYDKDIQSLFEIVDDEKELNKIFADFLAFKFKIEISELSDFYDSDYVRKMMK